MLLGGLLRIGYFVQIRVSIDFLRLILLWLDG